MELLDTRDLKSLGGKTPCGLDSRPWHHKKLPPSYYRRFFLKFVKFCGFVILVYERGLAKKRGLMAQDPVIKSYVSLDDEDKIEEKDGKEKPKKEEFSLEDERAFSVGLIALIVIIVIGAVIGIWYLVGHFGQGKDTAEPESEVTETEHSPEVLGEQEEVELIPEEEFEAEIFEGETYTVEADDTLYTIGIKLKVDWEDIAEVNNLERPYTLSPGQKLNIPKGGNANETSD